MSSCFISAKTLKYENQSFEKFPEYLSQLALQMALEISVLTICLGSWKKYKRSPRQIKYQKKMKFK